MEQVNPMKKHSKIRLRNLVVFLVVYAFFFSAFFEDTSGPYSVGVGGARGIAIGIPLVLLTFAALTVYYTVKSGGDWTRVKKNLKHNFLAGLSFTWKDKK